MRKASKRIEFAVTTSGQSATGAISSHELFTVGGTIAALAFGVVENTLQQSGAATIALGTAGDVDEFLAATTVSNALTDGVIWAPGTPATQMLYSGVDSKWALLNNTDIGYTIATAQLLSGIMTFYCYWYPISEGAWLEVQETANTLL
jgi:hypothetical protein